MRLLNTTTFKFEEFQGNTFPPYAILSHTWGEDEITFQDMQGASWGSKGESRKIQNTCARAAADGFDYVWIDTCCIDKTSSAELSEAINSMYRWYQESTVCYAYLADVPFDAGYGRRIRVVDDEFPRSRWFTRGWTLQELIAPSMIIFIDQEWQEMGTKSSLQREITEITGIPANILSEGDLESASIAQRMSWASYRKTTRVEDLAYCLMGIFGINMPLLYGEGEKAFTRLQEEILKVSDDYSLFAWLSDRYSGGLLAGSPAAFAWSGDIVSANSSSAASGAITVNNVGIHLKLLVTDIIDNRHPQVAILPCGVKGIPVKISLRASSETGECFERIESENEKEKRIPFDSSERLFGDKDVRESKYRERSICVRRDRLRPKHQSLLLEAAAHGKDVVVKLLLERGTLPECEDENGWTPLSRAAGNGHETVVRLLMERNNVNVNLKDNNGETPLSWVVGYGHEAVIRLLIERNDVNVNSKDNVGETPLSLAARNG